MPQPVRSSSNAKSALAVLAFLIGLALWVDFTRYHAHHHGDSLIPILASLYHWTPFFWAQDRFGMPIPLLATWIKSPELNLLFQNAISLFLGFATFALAARFLLPADEEWVPAAAIAAALFIATVAENERFDVFSGCQPYAPSLALGLWALLRIRGRPRDLRRWGDLLLALLTLCVAEWTNLAAIIPLAPLVVFRAAFKWKERQSWEAAGLGLLLLLIGVGFSMWLSTVSAPRSTNLELAPLHEWLDRWMEFGRACWSNLAPHTWERAAAVATGIGLLTLAVPQVRSRAKPLLLASAGLALAGIASFLAMGILGWVKGNGYSLRYALPTIMMLNSAGACLAALPLSIFWASMARIRAACGLTVLAAVAFVYGWPSLSAPNLAFEQKWDAKARDVIGANASHVAGNYWTVWPVVFRANWLLYGQHPERPIYGLAHRCEAIVDLARAVPRDQIRVAVFHGDRALGYLGVIPAAGWDLVERRQEIDVIRPR